METKYISLVFSLVNPVTGKIVSSTKCGTATNYPIRTGSDVRNLKQIVKQLYQNCLQHEKDHCIGYCIDDGTFDTLKVPYNVIKKLPI